MCKKKRGNKFPSALKEERTRERHEYFVNECKPRKTTCRCFLTLQTALKCKLIIHCPLLLLSLPLHKNHLRFEPTSESRTILKVFSYFIGLKLCFVKRLKKHKTSRISSYLYLRKCSEKNLKERYLHQFFKNTQTKWLVNKTKTIYEAKERVKT